MNPATNNKVFAGHNNELSCFIHRFVCSFPVVVLYSIADGWKERSVVPTPLLWREENVFELFSVLELYLSLAIFLI